jgi:hypothetical protein
MSDDERQALLEKMRASIEETRRMTPGQARARLDAERRRKEQEPFGRLTARA